MNLREARQRRPPSAIGVLVAALIASATATHCGRRIEEEPEPPPYRAKTCNTWCNLVYASCGGAYKDGYEPTQADIDECKESCTHGDDQPWVQQPDGTDLCKQTYIERVECVAALDCAERQEMWSQYGSVPIPETICGEELAAWHECIGE